MKEIRILQSGVEPIVFLDADATKLETYTKRISAVLEMGNVAIIQSSGGNIIVRPHKIESILVKEVNGKTSAEVSSPQLEPKVEVKDEEDHVDMITDGD